MDLNDQLDINYFPSVSEYTALLERAGFEVTLANLFDRPTALVGPTGLREWLRMFRSGALERVPSDKLTLFFDLMEQSARSRLFRDEQWFADYRRLRIVARVVR